MTITFEKLEGSNLLITETKQVTTRKTISTEQLFQQHSHLNARKIEIQQQMDGIVDQLAAINADPELEMTIANIPAKELKV